MIALRPHQERGARELRRAYQRVRRVVLVMPTGGGKTATASTLIAWAVAKGRRALFLCHIREVVLDTAARLRKAGVPCGVVMAGEPATEAPVQVASVATVAARGHHPPAEFVIFDECHHVVAQTFRAIAEQYPAAWVLGLTATPERADGRGLRDCFDEMVVGCTVAELQEAVDPATGHPYLAACDVIAPPRRLSGRELAEDPLDAWRRHAGGRSTVAFCATVEESAALAARFSAAGVPARHVDGTTPDAERTATLAALASGEVTVVCNVMVLTEGFDCPRVKVVLLARGCGSASAFVQMTGRALRAYNGERALLIDLSGAVHEHGMPDEERELSLDGIRRKAKKARPALSQCGACGFVVLGSRRGPACARCGAAWPKPPHVRVARAGLRAVAPGSLPTRSVLRAAYRELVNEAAARGFKPAWAGCRFKDIYGFWPKGLA